jgi:uncharacterized protein (TIGR03084 family)
MPVDMAALTADLAAESAELYELLSVLTEAQWDLATPAEGWTVRDQVTHLAYFDGTAVQAATDPEGFRADAAEVMAGGMDFPDRIAAEHRGLSGAEVFAWFQRERRAYLDTFAALDPGTQLPWYGPPMSAASSVTARLMETWAHGQDVVDALGVTRRPTARLRHVAHLGVRTLGWSFQVRGLPQPETTVRVELESPDGELWTWGPPDAGDRVRGTALDFCLVVTQRRHRRQSGLTVVGPVADAWLDVAQAYAGAPGPGRPFPEAEEVPA